LNKKKEELDCLENIYNEIINDILKPELKIHKKTIINKQFKLNFKYGL
jgi:hypothetical protein